MYTFLSARMMLAYKHCSALAKAPIQASGARSLSAAASSRTRSASCARSESLLNDVREIVKECTIRISENTRALRISAAFRQLALF